MGRPLKLTPDVRHMIASYIRAGAFAWVAAEAAGEALLAPFALIGAVPGGREMVLDLSGVEYFDTSGVRMLLNVKETLGERLTLIPGRAAPQSRPLDAVGCAA